MKGPGRKTTLGMATGDDGTSSKYLELYNWVFHFGDSLKDTLFGLERIRSIKARLEVPDI
jgi:hypothetical protein